jgi:hypothetical protein
VGVKLFMATFNSNNINDVVQNATQQAIGKGLQKVIPGDGVVAQAARSYIGASASRLLNSALFPGGAAVDTSVIGTARFVGSDNDDRARLSLSPSSPAILYRDPNSAILSPLRTTDGIVWPYTPSIGVSYTANYNSTQVTHSNYPNTSYNNSTVGEITCGGKFTANTPYEGQYLLAVMHFIKSATKMFYGLDPNRGTPPPVLRFSAHGPYMFNSVPVVITSCNFNLPTDVDYMIVSMQTPRSSQPTGLVHQTRVPTSIEIQVNLMPVISKTRNSNFGFKEYSSGALIGDAKNVGGLP